MDFTRDPADVAFREEVRRFVAENLPADVAERSRRGYHPAKADMLVWIHALARKGWSTPGWPTEWGGPGWSPLRRHIFEEESFLAGAPPLSIQGVSLVGPVIYTFGSVEQKARYLPAIASGEEFWGQGFSEPGAGSDLVHLTTRAERDGNHYVINGQKLWSSEAQMADQVFLLARTDTEAKPQRGISFLLCPANAPGLTIRPIISIDESLSLNEMFFDNVRVPVTNLVGEEGRGWSYAKFLLENERAFSAEVPRNKRNFERLRTIARQQTVRGRPVIEDENFSVRMAALEVELHSLEYLTLNTLYEKDSTKSIRPIGSILKIKGSELQQKIGDLTMEALGDEAAPFYPEPGHDLQSETLPGPKYAWGVSSDYFYRRATTIYGGTNEIQRNIIAKQILGL